MCCSNNGVIKLRSDPIRFSLHPNFPNANRPDPFLFITFPKTHQFPRVHASKPPKATASASASATSTLNDNLFVGLDESRSFYELLGIPETGTILEIKQAYKQLARKYHPDVSPPDRVEEYTQRFILVQEAYETLSDPKRRALYDRDIANGFHFAFSARRRYQCVDEMEDRGEWKNRWQSQLSELKRRSVYKDDSNDMSWGARMRRQKNQSSS